MVILGVACALLVGCVSAPIRNISASPVVSASGKTLSPEQVRTAILRAGSTLGWTMTPVAAGLVTGRLALRGHLAIVDVRYTATTYSITYKDSTNLDYRDGQIHKNYNGWIENLDRDIRANLLSS